MASLRKRGRVWYFRYVDADGVKQERKGCPDKRATEEMARAAETEAAKIKAGLIDIRAVKLSRAESTPVGEHLAEFISTLTAKSGDPKHVAQTRTYSSRFLELGAIDRVSELTPSAISGVLTILKSRNLSARTLNAHLTAIKALSRWLYREGRSASDYLISVGKFNEQADRRHDRRTIGIDDLRRLIEATRNSGSYQRMSGLDRSICYRLAISTGLRFSEIASITHESFALDGPGSTVTVTAAYTKNGEPATIHLPADLVEDLRRWLTYQPAGHPVFRLPEKGAAMLRVDLHGVGIPYRDSAGQVFDFHALRCQHATLLDLAGVSPRVVQRKMRHSTLELTGRYTKPRAADLE
jgi:integrase